MGIEEKYRLKEGGIFLIIYVKRDVVTLPVMEEAYQAGKICNFREEMDIIRSGEKKHRICIRAMW